MLKKNAAGKLFVYAHNILTDAPVTGDAANITAQVSIDGGASAAVADTNPTELAATDHPGVYVFDLTAAETNGDVLCVSATSTTDGVQLNPQIVYTLPADLDDDIYIAQVDRVIDDANARDEYTVVWYRDGVPVTSGITLPKIQVVQRSDGSDLVTESAMTQIGSTAYYKYDATGDGRSSQAETVIVVVKATIAGSERTFVTAIGRYH